MQRQPVKQGFDSRTPHITLSPNISIALVDVNNSTREETCIIWKCGLVGVALLFELQVSHHQNRRDGLEQGCTKQHQRQESVMHTVRRGTHKNRAHSKNGSHMKNGTHKNRAHTKKNVTQQKNGVHTKKQGTQKKTVSTAKNSAMRSAKMIRNIR